MSKDFKCIIEGCLSNQSYDAGYFVNLDKAGITVGINYERFY